MKSAPAAPPAPDYEGAAKNTAAGNMQMARYTTGANRVNQTNPWGSLTYDRQTTLDEDGYNRALSDWAAAGSDPSKRPDQNLFMMDNWTQNVSLDPRLQGALDSQLDVQRGRSDAANDMLGRVRDGFAQPFSAPDLETFLSGVNGVDQGSVGRAGSFTTSAGPINTNFSFLGGPNTSSLGRTGAFSTDANINVNAPQFTNDRQDQYSRAAFDSTMALLRPELDRVDERTRNRLIVQGLNPGSEASNTALDQMEDARTRQLNQLAAQSVLTGNEMSNRDFASLLAGFRTGNEAQGQRFGMQTSAFDTGIRGLAANAALQGQENQTQQQAFDQALTRFNTGNAANLAQFGMDQARQDQVLRTLSTNAQLRDADNAAQAQALAQALQRYGITYQDAVNRRQQPLNELNALLTGQQVNQPQFAGFATQGQIGGPDYLGATAARGQWDQGVYNAQAAQAAAGNNTLSSLLGAGMMAYGMSDRRLKKNVKKIGTSESGRDIYTWDWNSKAEKLGITDQPTVGVMAQENPDIAVKMPNGYLGVNYAAA